MNFWCLAGSLLPLRENGKACSLRSSSSFFLCHCAHPILHLTYFFFILVWLTPESDSSETALIESLDWSRFSNLRALPKLFNRVIYRSEGESFTYQSGCCPLSVSLCLALECLFRDLLTAQVIFASRAAVCTSSAERDRTKKDCREASSESVLYLRSVSLCAGMVHTHAQHT